MNSFKLWYRRQPVALRTLIAINVAFYLAWFLLVSVGGARSLGLFVQRHLALNPELPGVVLEAWQLVTYNFLHFGFLHVLFNMLWLWWIGREFEDLHGPHQMLALYLIGGVGGGLLSVLGYALMAGGAPPIVGASASVLAMMTAVVTLYPQKKIRLLFFGSVRLLYVVGVFLALDVLVGIAGTSNTAILAHLGGAGAGYLFVRAGERGVDLTSWAKVFFSDRSRSRGGYTPGRSTGLGGGSSSGGGLFGRLFGKSEGGRMSRRARGRETPREERYRKKAEQSRRRQEVDRILDKISEKGYEALSDDEKRTLEDASQQ